MKQIVISSDGDRFVYAVPDPVAEHLDEYCLAFCDWMVESPHGAPYRVGGGLCYREADFITYLNTWVFPHQPSHLVENLGWIDFGDPLPPQYGGCPELNF